MNSPVIEHTLRVAVVKPPTRFDVVAAPQMNEQLESLLADGVNHLIVDLTAVTFCDIAAIAVLVRAMRQTGVQSGSFRIVWPEAESGRRILSLTKFDQIFAMYPSVPAALDAFRGVR